MGGGTHTINARARLVRRVRSRGESKNGKDYPLIDVGEMELKPQRERKGRGCTPPDNEGTH